MDLAAIMYWGIEQEILLVGDSGSGFVDFANRPTN
jgi:hypothetical protein